MDNEDKRAEGIFLEELKSEYSKDLELKNALDSKANSMITISFLSSTLLITVAAFLLSRIDILVFPSKILLIIFGTGIISSIVAISYSLQSFKIKNYVFAIDDRPFFDDEGLIIQEKIDEKRFMSRTEFIGERIKDYLICLRYNIRTNQRKADKIGKGQLYFIISISLISSFLLLLLTFTAADILTPIQ